MSAAGMSRSTTTALSRSRPSSASYRPRRERTTLALLALTATHQASSAPALSVPIILAARHSEDAASPAKKDIGALWACMLGVNQFIGCVVVPYEEPQQHVIGKEAHSNSPGASCCGCASAGGLLPADCAGLVACAWLAARSAPASAWFALLAAQVSRTPSCTWRGQGAAASAASAACSTLLRACRSYSTIMWKASQGKPVLAACSCVASTHSAAPAAALAASDSAAGGARARASAPSRSSC